MRAVLGVPDGGGDAARRRGPVGLRLLAWLLHDGLSVPLLAVLGDYPYFFAADSNSNTLILYF